jgi:cardiolipin synthase
MLAAAGVKYFIFRPEISTFRLRKSRLRRLHRKLACIDAREAFVGGINIDDDGPPGARSMPRLDFAVRVRGPLLEPIHNTMCNLWSQLRLVNLGRRYSPSPPPSPTIAPQGSVTATFLARDNVRHRHDIEDAYLAALEEAKESVIIANSYFLPGRQFRNALIATVKRGVKVTLLIQGRVEYRFLHYASVGGYDRLMAAGVDVFEYHKSFLHAKVAVIDQRWATVGSSNIDPFSLLLAREANVVVDDAGFASELERRLQRAIAEGATPLAKAHPLALYQRTIHWLAYGLARLMIGLTGYGRNF